MNDEEAQGVLLAIGPPIKWRYRLTQRGSPVWSADCYTRDTRWYHFHVFAPYERDLGADEDGRPFQWQVTLSCVDEVAPHPADDGTGLSPKQAILDWNFRSYTAEDAKAICARLAVNEDAAEVEYLNARWYPLSWLAGRRYYFKRYHRLDEEVADIRRYNNVLAYYLVYAERRGRWCRFHAGYRVTKDGKRRGTFPYQPERSRHATAPRRYTTAGAAKAACERHYTVGKWK